MASREASLKVTLRTGAFASGVRSMGDMVVSAGRRMGSAISGPLNKGLHAAKHSFHELKHSIMEVGTEIAGIGGGISIGLFVEEAVQLEAQAGKIAMKLRHMGEAAGEMKNPMDTAREAAEKFGATMPEMLTAYEHLLDRTGDPVFSEEALESVALMENAFRMTSEQSAEFVASLSKQGVAADAIKGEILPALMDLTNRGGAGMEDIAGASGKILKSMAAIGIKGKEGFSTVVGMLNMTSAQGGPVEERLMGISKVLLQLGQKTFLHKMGQQVHGAAGHISTANTQLQNMQAILSKKGGLQALKQSLGVSAKTASIFNTIVQPYMDALNEASKQGKSSEQQIEIASEAFAESLKKSTESTSTEATLREESAKRTKEKARVLELAMDRVKDAFTNPKILNAIDKVAKNLPDMAEAIAKFVGWIVENPREAAASIILGKVALAFTGATLEAVIASGLKSVFGKAALMSAASNIGTSAMGIGGSMGVTGGVAAGAAGGAAMIGGALVAGAAGYMAGTAIYEHGGMKEGQENESSSMTNADSAVGSASVLTSKSGATKITAALKSLSDAKANIEANKSTTNTLFGNVASVFTGADSPSTMRSNKIQEIADEEARLKKTLESLRGSAQALSGAMEKAAGAANQQASVGTTRGPLKAPDSRPGAAPVGG